ncbi:hypothetical protein BaRGS_00013184 [Batillaria attramentaria]|uniref:Neuroparsin n=1 Tax=Batillaria attramentaria TaxID=370345 RepID=A0ABD0L899_9CAEN
MECRLLLLGLTCLLVSPGPGVEPANPGCSPNICMLVDCMYVSPDSCAAPSVYVANGGFCGCCPACLLALGEGASCGSSLMHGRCQSGLVCDSVTETCRRV